MTVLDFLTGTLGLSPDRADMHLRSSFVRLYSGDDWVSVSDGSREIGDGEKLVLQPPAVTDET